MEYCEKCGKAIYRSIWDAAWSQDAPPQISLSGITNYCEGHTGEDKDGRPQGRGGKKGNRAI